MRSRRRSASGVFVTILNYWQPAYLLHLRAAVSRISVNNDDGFHIVLVVEIKRLIFLSWPVYEIVIAPLIAEVLVIDGYLIALRGGYDKIGVTFLI